MMTIARCPFKACLLVLCISVVLAACDSPAPVKKPNILFCIADDASFPYMGAYGTSWVTTPGFDRVSNEGLLFMRAYTPNAKCAPSRACILTGRNSWQLAEAANHVPFFPERFTTFMESLQDHGYFTGHTAKGWSPGVSGEKDGVKRLLTGRAYNERKLDPATPDISNNDYAANFEDFLEARPADQPFCFWFGALEPHRKYTFGAGIAQGGKSVGDIDKVPDFWPDNDTVRTDLLDYAFELEHFDQHLMRMLEILDRRGELDNTIVVVTADNGMPFPRVKGQAYEMSNHLPLAIMWKDGIKAPGRRVEDFVSFIDFAPTFLEVSGIRPDSSGMEVQGKSLVPYFKSADAAREDNYVLIGKERHDVGRPHDWGYPIRGLVKGKFLYVRNYEPSRWPAGDPQTGYLNTDGGATKTWLIKHRKDAEHYWRMNLGKRAEEELYDISVDPYCTENLALNPEFANIAAEMKTSMEDELRRQQDPRMFGNGHIFDEYPYAQERNRNFYERYMNGEKIDAPWVSETDFEPDFPD